MAVGDLINVINTQVGNLSNYQPAAGVEVIVTWIPNASNIQVYLTNGVAESGWFNVATATARYTNMKMCITNTIYLGIYTTGVTGAFSGIQTK
tara:strand:- start:22 stop:300 length:279 start_codon:yes stop_codon:yes gene_type:complete